MKTFLTPNWLVLILALACPLACAPEQKAPLPLNRVTEKVEQPPCAEEISPADVLTQHDNCQRTGANLHETALTPEKVHSAEFGRLFDWQVEGQIYAQPLYVSHVTLNRESVNLVIVATMENNVYAFRTPAADSDIRPSDSPEWMVSNKVLGLPLPKDYMFMDWGFITGYNIEPKIGITSTPVIDRKRGLLFLTVKSGICDPLPCHQISYKLFAIDIASGAVRDKVEIAGPASVQPAFDAHNQLQRAALLEANDRIYIAFGSHQDQQPYEGWLFAYDAGNLHQPPHVFCSSCGIPIPADKQCKQQSHCDGGIWQAGAGPALDEDGNVYLATGNGAYEPTVHNLGSSFIKLDKDLNVIGSWTPVNFACLNRTDSDLGSAGPLVLSRPDVSPVLIAGGKEGLLYAISAEALGGTQVGLGKRPGTFKPCTDPGDYTPDPSGPGYVSIQAAPQWAPNILIDAIAYFDPAILAMGFHHIHGAPVFWNVRGKDRNHSLIYLSAERDFLRAFEYPQDFERPPSPTHEPQDSFQSNCTNSPTNMPGMPGGFLTISANASNPDSGIVWASMPRPGKNALVQVVSGVLRAYRAYTEPGTNKPGPLPLTELWNSDYGTDIPKKCSDAEPVNNNQVGNFAKYTPPTVANGKVYAATFSNSLVVYGIRTPRSMAEINGFNARLTLGPLPKTVQPGTHIPVSVVATNTGTTLWRAETRLASWLNTATPSSETTALIPEKAVGRGRSYPFHFTITAPAEEGEYYYSWGLVGPSGNRFGPSTPEWTLSVVREHCEPVRQRAERLVSELKREGLNPGEVPDPSKSNLVKNATAQIMSIERDAKKYGCRLPPVEMSKT